MFKFNNKCKRIYDPAKLDNNQKLLNIFEKSLMIDVLTEL